MQDNRVILTGSERKQIPNRQLITGIGAKPDPEDIIKVTLIIRPKDPIPTTLLHSGLYRPEHFSREDIAAMHGTTAMDMLTVRHFAETSRLTVLEENALLCYMKLSGAVKHMESAFGTALKHVQVGQRIYRERVGALTIPRELEDIITGVHGLDNRPQASPHIRPAATSPAGNTPLQIAAAYKFPTGDGSGQIIGIIELGGGFIQADLDTYFASLGLPTPNVVAKNVDTGQNQPTNDPNGPDGEVMLDIEIAGAIAPKATINVYFAENNDDKGFLDAINEAVKDGATVISISWGSAEDGWTPMSLTNYDNAFKKAVALGINVTVASGDNGSSDRPVFQTGLTYNKGDIIRYTDKNIYRCQLTNTQNIPPTNTSHWQRIVPPPLAVDFPASSPNVLGCGGTSLQGAAGSPQETVWNSLGNGGYHFGPGGGVSSYFPKPAYQLSTNVPAPPVAAGGRGVPDIAGDADPETGYKIRVDGTNTVVGGTSAVAPLWAGLIALIAQQTGKKMPFLNAILYKNPAALNDIITGTNDVGPGDGKYVAAPGWDPCTGLGSPIGASVLALVKTSPAPPPTPIHTGGTGQTGSKSAAPAAHSGSNPILHDEDIPGQQPILAESIEAECIVAIMGMATNLANTAITAITALAKIKKNS